MTTLDEQPGIVSNTFQCPTSFAQERLWFLDQFEPNSSLYNLSSVIRIAGVFSLTALQSSYDAIINRHETLRTSFGIENDRPIQIIMPELHLPIRFIDLTASPREMREAEVVRIAQEDTGTSFNLSHGPLIRMTVVKLDEIEHALMVVFHHIIFDGWSAKVFFNELHQYYSFYTNGKPIALPEITIQYADYAAWQKEWLHGEALEQEVTFWKGHLVGAPALLEIPTDRPRPPVQSYQGARLNFTLSHELTQALDRLSRKNNVTLFMTMLAAFEVFLGRYTGQHDFVIGTPIAGRTRVEIEALIGFFANTIVLRANLAGDPTFTHMLQRVRDVALDAFVHQELPFEKLVEELQPTRSLSYHPLFQVMFAFQNIAEDQLALGDLNIDEIKIVRQNAKFDLTLYAWSDDDGCIKGSIEYNTDLFYDATVQRMKDNFIILLQGIVAHPDHPIALLPIMTEAERHDILHNWNGTHTASSLQQCIHEVITEQAERTPNAIAIVAHGQELTYRALNHQANQLARYLMARGVGPEQRVGVCINRSIDMIVAILGILKAGGAYVPLDPEYPAERLAFMVHDAELVALIVQEETAQIIPTFTGQRIALDTDRATITQEDTTNVAHTTFPNHLAYIIYTSGSTGVPKGVQIPHRAVVNFLTAMHHTLGITANDVGLALTSISFDIAGLEIYLPLIVGARVVIVSREIAADARELAQVIHSADITLMQATPATWRSLIDTGWSGLSTLKMICGGEALSRDLGNALLERGAVLWNMYGPTETTIWSTVHQVTHSEGAIPIGRPIDNTQIYLLDAQLQPVPVGVPGELYIGGEGLARGYRGRSDLTSERFIPNPFTDVMNARLYHTGDVARYRPDGTIDYLGRIDTQVKVRGFRIELEEIETILNQHPAIHQSAVIVREDNPNDQRIVAYLTVTGDEPVSSDLRAYLQTRLPTYMIPAAYVMLPAFPLTPNGKIDRKTLPAPEGDLSSSVGYIAPRTPEEVTVAEIWANILGVDHVGAEDNFFELGGHSLLATQMMSRIHTAFQVKVPLRTLFDATTVASFAAAISTLKELAPAQKMPLVPIPRSTRVNRRSDET